MNLAEILLILVFIVNINCRSDIISNLQKALQWIHTTKNPPFECFFGLSITYGALSSSNRSFVTIDRDLSHIQNSMKDRNAFEGIVIDAIQQEGFKLHRHLLHDMLHVKGSSKSISLSHFLDGIESGEPSRETSDTCIAQILSTKSCVVSNRCLSLISPNNASTGYHKAHQILIALLLGSQRCESRLTHNKSLRVVLADLCCSTLSELRTIAKLQYPAMLRDLLLEQVIGGKIQSLRKALGFIQMQ